MFERLQSNSVSTLFCRGAKLICEYNKTECTYSVNKGKKQTYGPVPLKNELCLNKTPYYGLWGEIIFDTFNIGV